MPRSTRYLQNGYIYHLTHRCHDGRFYLRFKRERDLYREWLRIGVRRYHVAILGYAITSNHVHLVVDVMDRLSVAHMMRLAAGSVAQARYRRKGGEDSMWEHPYQCTRIETGQHLLNCLCYVDLNMIRAGVVRHPEQWRWCGYDELTGQRERYRIVDIDQLLKRTRFPSMQRFSSYYRESIREELASGNTARQDCWTKAIAVGSEMFIDSVIQTGTRRQVVGKQEYTLPNRNTVWVAI